MKVVILKLVEIPEPQFCEGVVALRDQYSHPSLEFQ
jgi:hypothetical protein